MRKAVAGPRPLLQRFYLLSVFIFSVSVCIFLTRIFTAVMPMVAAGLIIDDPSLLPVRRLVPLVGTVFFWFGFGLCLRNVCCGCRWAGPSPSGHFRCMAATRAFPREAGVACDSKRRCSRRSSCMRPWNSRLCHRRFFLSFLFVSVLKPPCP